MSEALQALYAGDAERGRALLPPDDELTVFEAAAFARVERLRRILDDDPAQANAFAEDGFTPLHMAIFGGSEEAVRLLIERGANLEAVSTGSIAQVTPLGTAAFVRSLPLSRVLLDSGADVNTTMEGGFVVLHTAAQNDDVELVRLFLERGADPSAALADGRRAADLATSDEVRELLSERDRDPAG